MQNPTTTSAAPLESVVIEAAVKNSLSRQQTAIMSSSESPVAQGEVCTPAPRLLDSDPSKFRSLKRVIVIGRPGSGTDGVGDALKTLGFKVYDFQAASSRYKRDFPLWLEAARLRQEGRPYNKSDYDKVIGDHDAIVGAPACFFDEDFVTLYSGVKVILVTRDSDAGYAHNKLLNSVDSRFWQRIDSAYSGNIAQLFNDCIWTNSDQAIRNTVRERNLLEIQNLIAWVPLCEFLGVMVPETPAPQLHDNTMQSELATRPQRWTLETAKKTSHFAISTLTNILTIAFVTLVSALAVSLGGLGLFKLSSSGSQLLVFVLACSQIRDVTRLLAAGIAALTLVSGFIAGYGVALRRHSKTATVDSPIHDHHRRNRNGHRRGKQGRGRQTEGRENSRPERPTLAEWSGVQENIRRDDAEVSREGRATLEEWNNGKHVTFHVTHKRTGAGQDIFSGPRKVLSVTEESM